MPVYGLSPSSAIFQVVICFEIIRPFKSGARNKEYEDIL